MNRCDGPAFEVSLAPNLDVVSGEVAAAFTQEEMRNTKYVYRLIQTEKHGQVMRNGFPGLMRIIGIEGIDSGFKGLRKLAGEETFGGLSLVSTDPQNRTPIDEYINIIGGGGMGIAAGWGDSHDLIYHAAGSLLATPRVRDVMVGGAVAAANDGSSDEVLASLDQITEKMQGFWRLGHDMKGVFTYPVASNIGTLLRSQGKEVNQAEVNEIVEEQLAAIMYICDAKFFTEVK